MTRRGQLRMSLAERPRYVGNPVQGNRATSIVAGAISGNVIAQWGRLSAGRFPRAYPRNEVDRLRHSAMAVRRTVRQEPADTKSRKTKPLPSSEAVLDGALLDLAVRKAVPFPRGQAKPWSRE